MASRKKRILFATLAVLGSVVVCLAVLDLVVAWIQPGSSYRKWYDASLTYLLDDATDWKLEPRKYAWGQVNDFGFRGPALPFARAPGRLRIALLGGSAAFDLYKRDDQTWAAQLERLLQDKLGRPVEVLNTGTPGYSTWQCRRLLTARLLRWEPDVVLLYELYNDSLTFRHASVDDIKRGWKLNALANYIGAAAHPGPSFDLLGSVLPHVTDYVRMLMVQAEIAASKRESDRFWVDLDLTAQVQPEALAFYRDNRAAIAKELERAGGIPLIVITQASLIRADNTPDEQQRIHYWYRGVSHERLVQAYRDAWDIDRGLAKECANVALIPAHEHVPASLEYFVDEVHLNHAGSALLAGYVAQQLIDRDLLPK